jgi:Mn2+/Fe2+ NRAMP family transporter
LTLREATRADATKEKRFAALRRILAGLGPGIVTGAADDDPSGVATYSIAGAQLGTALLWTAIFTWPMMSAVQTMCARIGMVTGEGLSGALGKKFPRWALVIASVALLVANAFNVGADLAGMADAAEMLSGVASHYFVIVFGAGIACATIWLPYARLAGVLKWLALSLLAYVITAFVVGVDWSVVVRAALIPSVPPGRDGWATLVAILGTTISPYLFYWQASSEVEEQKAMGRERLSSRLGATAAEILERTIDVRTGTFFSNIVMFFVILTTASTLHRHGTTHIETSRQAAEALTPLAGRFASTLYTVGIFGVGALAIPTLTGSAAYALAETFGWRQGLGEKPARAHHFYGVILLSMTIGVALDFAHINPVRALFWTAVINGVLAPFLLIGILVVASDETLMQKQPSSIVSRCVVGLTAAVMFGAALAMIFV